MGRREVTARSQGTSPGHLILEPGVSQNPVPVGPRLLQRTEELTGMPTVTQGTCHQLVQDSDGTRRRACLSPEPTGTTTGPSAAA